MWGQQGIPPACLMKGTQLSLTPILCSHLQSQAPLPMSITPSVIDTPHSPTLPGGLKAIKIYSNLSSELTLQLVLCIMFVVPGYQPDISLDS